MKKIQLFLLQGLLSSVPLYTLTAQTTTPSTHYAVETGIVAGHGDYSPFWFTANRQGLSSVKTENGYLRAGIFHSQALGRHFTWKAGLDLATAYNYTSSFVVQQAYADLSYRWLNLSIGSKERTPELRNPKLSTGGLVESNSARPVPQVRIEIPQYISVPGTNHWLHIKGHLAYGTFTDNNWQEDFARSGNLYTKDVLYHSKSFFMKVGKKESFPLEFEAGLQMAAQFGGKQYVEGQKEPIMKKCPNCGREIYPVISTAILVLVRKEDSLLLVHARNFKGTFNSLVAGFLETGETLEECVAREVKEETGLDVKNIRYFGSQPWPYPSGLMVGFIADYAGGDIHLQDDELSSGNFYTRDHLPELPRKLSLARKMIDWWIAQQ